MADFVNYFELATLCYLPTRWNVKDVLEVTGTFVDGVGGYIKIFLDQNITKYPLNNHFKAIMRQLVAKLMTF